MPKIEIELDNGIKKVVEFDNNFTDDDIDEVRNQLSSQYQSTQKNTNIAEQKQVQPKTIMVDNETPQVITGGISKEEYKNTINNMPLDILGGKKKETDWTALNNQVIADKGLSLEDKKALFKQIKDTRDMSAEWQEDGQRSVNNSAAIIKGLGAVMGGEGLPALATGATLFGLGDGILERKKPLDTIKEIGLMAAGGQILSKTPQVINLLSKTPVGKAIANNVKPLINKAVNSPVGKNITNFLNKEIKIENKFSKNISNPVPEATKKITPNQYGVPQNNQVLNQNIANQMQSNINAEKELLREYKTLHSDMVKKYGNIKNLKAQAVKDMPMNAQYGTVSDAINDYRNIIEYEKLLGEAKYINNPYKSASTEQKFEYINDVAPLPEKINQQALQEISVKDLSKLFGYKNEINNNNFIKPVTLKTDSVPNFDKVTDLKDWMTKNIDILGEVTIKSNNRTINLSKSNIGRSLKGIKGKDIKRNSYADLKNLVENSEYSYKKPVDSKHAHKNNGQEIYHNAFIYDGKPYGIEISIDIPKGGKSPYPYAGHKIKIIEMAPTDNVTNFLKGNVRDQVSAENIVPLPTYKALSDWQSLENLPRQGGKNTLNNIIIDNAENFKPSKVKTSQRGGLETLNKYLGEDVANSATDTTYNVRGKDIAKSEFESLSTEIQQQLINDSENLSDVATYAKAQNIINEIENGNIPVNTINNWLKSGTLKGQGLQSQQFLAPDTVEGAIVAMQKEINDTIPKSVSNVIDNAKNIIDYVQTKAKNSLEAERLLRTKLGEISPIAKNKIVKELKTLYNEGNLNEENLINSIKRHFNIKEISNDDVLEIRNLVNNYQQAETQRQKDVAMALLKRKIEEVKPVTLGRKISTLQAGAQLLNPKTVIRNILGNTNYGLMEDITQSLIATPIDKLMSKITGQRSIMPTNLLTQGKGLLNGAKMGLEDVALGIDTSANAGKFDLWGGRTFRDGGLTSDIEKAMNYALRVPDRAAYQAVYEETIENMMRAQGLKEPTKEILEQANLEALQRTFQDDSTLAKAGQGLKKWLNAGKDWGFGDLILKYAKTPSNILARGIDYSPIGLGKGLYEIVAPNVIKSMPFNQRQAVMDISRGLMGSGIMGAGYLTAKNKIASGKREDKQKYNANLLAQGKTPYSLQIGDKSYTYDWDVPISMAFSAGADVNDSGSLLESILASTNTLTEQPLLQGLQKIAGGGFKSAPENILDSIIEMPLSFYPSILRNTAYTIDPYKRETKDNTKGVLGGIKTMGNRALSYTPGLSTLLPEKYDITGDKVSRGDTTGERFVNAMLNPANVTKLSDNETLNKSVNLYEQTGESGALYNVVPQKIKINGEDKILTKEQRSQYQKEMGQISQIIRENLFTNDEFLALSDGEKAEELKMWNEIVNNAVKYKMFGIEPYKYKNQTYNIIDFYEDYLN